MKEKIRQYQAEGIVVEFEAVRCIHAAECVHGLPEVFDAETRPWIQPEKASADAIADVVRRCPTGALQYRRSDGGAAEVPATENTVRVIANGPLYVAGQLRLHLPDGQVREETRVALCRCGDSKTKPLCDNTHLEKNFTDAGTAPEHSMGPKSDTTDGLLKVTLVPNGPILFEGSIQVIAADSIVTEGGKGAFCRCGSSKSKPYCDGSHGAAGFVAD